jgi:hypothetical protein
MVSGHGGRNQANIRYKVGFDCVAPQWGPATEAGIRARGKSSL